MNFSLFFIDDFKGKGKIPHTEDKSGKAHSRPIGLDLSRIDFQVPIRSRRRELLSAYRPIGNFLYLRGNLPPEDKSGKADTDPIYDLSEGKAGRPEGRIRIQFQNSVKGYGKRTTHWLKEEVKDGRRPKEFSNESFLGRPERGQQGITPRGSQRKRCLSALS